MKTTKRILTAFFFVLFTNFLQAQIVKIENDRLVVSDKTPREVTELDLSDLGLESLPTNISDFYNLKVLNLSNNRISSVNGLKQLVDLEKLIVNNNPELKPASFNNEIGKLTKLRVLTVSNSNLSYIPYSFYNLPGLEELDVSHNRIKIISFEIQKLKSLTFLNLNNNSIEFIDNGILGLYNLKEIRLSDNSILNLPHLFLQLASLDQLKKLSIDFDKYTEFPQDFMLLNNILELRLTNCNSYYPESFVSLFSTLNKITIEGALSESEMNVLLEDINSTELKQLVLINSKLRFIPQELTKLKNLEEIVLNTESLENISSGVSRLTVLNSITVASENLDVELTLSNLITARSLKSLSLVKSRLSNLPQQISRIRNLEFLYVQAANFEELPKSLTLLDQLQRVEVYTDKNLIGNLEFLRTEMNTCEFVVNSVPYTGKKNGLNPPLQVVDVSFEEFIINPNQDKTIRTKSGTELIIPANAFLNSKGEPVKNNVRISYREFNDPIDMVFAGVPMTEGIGGETYTYSSAGMLEFRAYQQNEELQPNPNNLITVNYNSPFSGNDYDLFYLNPENSNWENIGKDSIINEEAVSQETVEVTGELEEFPTRPVYPVRPYKHSPINISMSKKQLRRSGRREPIISVASDLRRVKRDTNNKVYSEMKAFNRLKWKLDFNVNTTKEERELFDQFRENLSLYNVQANRWRNSRNNSNFVWGQISYVDDFWLEPNAERDNFNLVFSRSGELIKVPVVPRNMSKNVEVTQRKLKNYYSNYKKELSKRRADWDLIDSKFGEEMYSYEQAVQKYDEELTAYRKAMEQYNSIELNKLKTFAANEGGVVRSFQLSGFGTFNCDIINRMNFPKKILAKFSGNGNRILDVKRIYILDKENNGLLTFDNPKEAFFDRSHSNSLIAILENDQIGVLSNSDFDKDKIADKEYVAKLKVYDMKTTTIGELRKNADFF